MEYSMRLVEKHCSKYLMMFGECIQLHPHTWQIDCDLERRKLAKCAETNPEIVHIKQVCGKQFHVYETCMTEFQSEPEKCTDFFNVFSSCAQDALKTYGLSASNTKVLQKGLVRVRHSVAPKNWKYWYSYIGEIVPNVDSNSE